MEENIWFKTLENLKKMPLREEEPVKKEDDLHCMTCGGSGWVPVVEENGHTYMKHCPDCYEKRRLRARLKQSGIRPDDYARYSLSRFDPNRSPEARKMLELACKYLQNHKKNGPGFGAFGKAGTGKTHICIGICLELTKRFKEPHFYFAYRAEMPNLVKAARGFDSDYEEAMYKWKTCDNLYIDDLLKLSGRMSKGNLVDTDRDEMRILFDLVNARYVNNLTTLFSSELSLNEITRIDGALGSRIYDMIKPYGIGVSGANERLRRI